MTIEELAAELGLDETVEVSVMVAAYEKLCASCKSTIATSSEKAERRMAKQKLAEVERELGPTVQFFQAKAEVEARLKDIEQVLRDGFGSVTPYFEEIEKWLPLCEDTKLKLRIHSLKESSARPPVEPVRPPVVRVEDDKATIAPFEESEIEEMAPVEDAKPIAEPEPPRTEVLKSEPEKPVEKSVKTKPASAPVEKPVDVNPTQKRVEAIDWDRLATESIFYGKHFKKNICGVKTQIVLQDTLQFGRLGTPGLDIELPLQVHSIPEDKMQNCNKAISRKHFQIRQKDSVVCLLDGSFLENGQRKKSSGGIYVDGQRIDEKHLNAEEKGLLTLINSGLRPERPAFRFQMLPRAKYQIENNVLVSLKQEGGSAQTHSSLFLERAEGYIERVLCLWGPVSCGIFSSKLSAYVLIPWEKGFCLWSEEKGLVSKKEAEKIWSI